MGASDPGQILTLMNQLKISEQLEKITEEIVKSAEPETNS